MKITQRDVDRLAPGEYRDHEVPGLLLLIRASGHRSFALRYTLPGTRQRKRLSLGPTSVVSLAGARAEARKRLGGMYAGVDPARELRPAPGPTVGELVDRYLAEVPLSPATAKEWRRVADVEFAPIRNEPAKALKRADIRALGAAICRRSGYTANRAHVILRAAYTWALSQDILEATPFVGLKQPFAGELRSDRVLSAEELRALVFTLDELRKPKREVKYRDKETDGIRTRIEVGGDHYADALLILLLTGVRRRAAIEARASELFSLELEDSNDIESTAEWRIAPERQKMRETKRTAAKAHVVPLSRQAAAVFRHRLRAVAGSEVLFPRVRAPRAIARPSTWWSSRWIRKLNERMSELLGAPVPTWKVHNLRHTLATHIEEELRVAESTTAGILGHSSGRGVTSRYALAQHLTERRKALQAWADWLDGLRRTGFRVAGGTASGH